MEDWKVEEWLDKLAGGATCADPNQIIIRADSLQSDLQSAQGSENGEDSCDLFGTDDSDSEQEDVLASSQAGNEDPWWMPPPLELNYEALKHTATMFLPGSHGECLYITPMDGGGSHEIRVLHFEDGWSCIARFARFSESELLEKIESELATMAYVRKHTTIPVPEVYFVNYNPNHVVGATFVLMERMQGDNAASLYNHVGFEDKLDILGGMGEVAGKLAGLKFDRVGSFREGGSLGPMLNTTGEDKVLDEPAFFTTADYFDAFINENNLDRTEAARAHYPAVKKELRAFLTKNFNNATLHAPYRLIHHDLNLQNIMVAQGDDGKFRVSGVIDWDLSHTGPLYYLCEYPRFLRDYEDEPQYHAGNKLLRQRFAASLAAQFPRGSADRKQVRQAFREKFYEMTKVDNFFLSAVWHQDMEELMTKLFLDGMRGEGLEAEKKPYGRFIMWSPDEEVELDEEK